MAMDHLLGKKSPWNSIKLLLVFTSSTLTTSGTANIISKHLIARRGGAGGVMPPGDPRAVGAALLVYKCNRWWSPPLGGDYCGLLSRWALGTYYPRGVTGGFIVRY
jgi:hypothetical protein